MTLTKEKMPVSTGVQGKGKSSMVAFSDARPDWMGEGSKGSENVRIEDLTIPRLSIIQSLSPQRQKQEPSYIPGADEGMIFNTVTNKLYTPPITVIPVYFRKEVVVWKKRFAGGGFKGAFKTMDEALAFIETKPDRVALDNDGKPVDAYEALDTAHQFVLLADKEEEITEAVLSLQKTGLTFSRKFNSMIALAGGDRFSHAYYLNTFLDKRDKGTFYSWKYSSPLGFVSRDLYGKAEKLWHSVSSGAKNVVYEESSDPAPSTEDRDF